jgi:hypothetical protein
MLSLHPLVLVSSLAREHTHTRTHTRTHTHTCSTQAVKSLMIQFQGETDALNKRAKKAEEAFYSVYALMSEAPDPTPLLEAALQRQRHAAELEVENEKLNKTVKECVSVVAHVAVTPTRVSACRRTPQSLTQTSFNTGAYAYSLG